LQLVRFRAQKIKTLPGSMEAVGNSDIPVYVDGSRTEEELRRALESLREITRGSVLLVFGSQGGESLEARRRLGALAASLANYTVITADNPGREGAMDIAEEVERGFFGRGERTHHIELDRAQAIDEIVQMATPGDAVLIAGKGDVRHQEFADTIVPFDDRDFARAALETHGTGLAKSVRHPAHVPVLASAHVEEHAHAHA
jgi:UDP-N-acetylmuramoyl-L-alanyl-D-glutamate--2,6-diaminopimelate ligase